MKDEPSSLYLHIPFCDELCSYCDFLKIPSSSHLQDSYSAALKKEISSIKTKELKTIFIGGGTPSALSPEQLKDLLSFLRNSFRVSGEFTLEANPESLTFEKAKICRQYGVNRISLGVQSFSEPILSLLGRRHGEKEVREAADNIKKAGFDNFNFDFMFGIRGQNQQMLLDDIVKAAELGATHLSFYALQVEDKTPLSKLAGIEQSPDEEADEYDFLYRKCAEYGYERYEVSNYAKKGFESEHNLVYWHNLPYYACGAGATSYVGGIRKVRTKNIIDYIKGQNIIASETEEGPQEKEFDYLMLALRLKDGFALADFQARFGKDFLVSYKKELNLIDGEYQIADGRFSIKPEKLFVLDAILVDLLHFAPEEDE